MQVVFFYDLGKDELLKLLEMGLEKDGRSSAHAIVDDEEAAKELIENAHKSLNSALLFLMIPLNCWLNGRGFITSAVKHGGPFNKPTNEFNVPT